MTVRTVNLFLIVNNACCGNVVENNEHSNATSSVSISARWWEDKSRVFSSSAHEVEERCSAVFRKRSSRLIKDLCAREWTCMFSAC